MKVTVSKVPNRASKIDRLLNRVSRKGKRPSAREIAERNATKTAQTIRRIFANGTERS